MHIYVKKPLPEQYQAYMFCFIFGFNMLMFTFNNLMRLAVGNTYYLDTILMFMCYIFVFIHTLRNIGSALRLKHIIFLLIMILLPIFMCSYSEVTQKILSDQLPYCVIAFFIAISLVDYAATWNCLYKFSWLILAITFLDCFVLKLFDETSHTLGYAALFPAVIFSIEIIQNSNDKIKNILGLGLACVLVVQADTAGALAAVALTMILAMLFVIRKFKSWAFVLIALVLGAVAFIVNNVVTIATFLADKFSAFNLRIDLLLEISSTGISNDRFRDSIYEYCFQYAKEHFFLGCGIGNDRFLITQHTLVHDQTMVSNYPHNVFLEFMIQFGMFFGIILGIILIVFLTKYLLVEKNLEAQKIAILLVGMGFFPLLYSSSYIENACFFALIGFAWKRKDIIKFEKLSRKRIIYMKK